MRFASLVLFLSISIATLFAQKTTFTLQEENDSYISGTDRGYTNGTRLLWSWMPHSGSKMDSVAGILCFGEKSDTCERYVSAGLGQTMYTPQNLAARTPVAGDRPYGGWLFGTMMFDATRSHTNDHLELYAGVIGRHAHAEQAQVFIHRHVTPAATDPAGWNNQIGEWPAFLARYERSVKVLPRRPSATGVEWFDVAPAVGASAGNVFVDANAATTIRLGYNLPARAVRSIAATAMSLRSNVKAVPRPNLNWDAYVYAKGSASYVARNIFIDAEDQTYRIERTPELREHRFGASVRYRNVRLAYEHTWRSSEFGVHVGSRSRDARPQSFDMLLISVGPNP